MPPKASVESAGEPRRSGRLASLPAAAVAESKPKAPRATKKRSAEAVDGADEKTAKAKKAKAAADTEDAEAKAGEEAAAESSAPQTAPANIEIGDSLPTLTLKNEKAEDIQIADLASEKGVIIFLVPKADTPGCTNQACGFRDIYPDFTGLDYTVYCLSADSPTAQTKWQTKKSLPYPLISDPQRVLITALGAGAGGKTKRSHFIFAKGGKLVDKKLPVSPADRQVPKLALEFVKSQTAPA